MNTKNGFSIRKPVSVWNQPLKANFKDFFKSLTKAMTQGISGNFGNAAKDAIDALSAIGIEKDCGQVAWLLIHRSIIQAIYSLVEENLELIRTSPSGFWNLREQSNLSMEDFGAISSKLDLSLEEADLVINEQFFKNPRELPIIQDIQRPFSQWLQGVGLTKVQAKAISERLPSYFVFALNDQWRTHRTDYSCLEESLDTPFTKASEREHAWLRYSAWLQKQVDERMFFEAFSLRQVYIPLRGYYDKRIEEKDDKKIGRTLIGIKTTRVVFDLEKQLNEWINKPDPQDSVRIISGGPGCGKSSFTKMFAARQSAKQEMRVLFVPLHLFEPTDDLVDAIRNFVRYDPYLPPNPLDPEERKARLLLIFDGLDELSMQGKVAAEIAQQFVREVQKKADLFNMGQPRLKVLISGRELVVQANASEFRRAQQVLHILPYYLTSYEGIDFVDPQNLLEQDQRNVWWASYGNASGHGYRGMPEILNRDELAEITSQPLLNYLVALSFTRGRLDFTKESNLNAIYEDLLKAVYQRGWAEHQHPSIRDVQEDQFFRILEEIAVAAWHGDGRTTTVREIEAHCNQSGLKSLLEKFQEGASQGVTRLLLAFYFRQSGQRMTGDQTFEFTHKSFGEYLASRRIVRGIQQLDRELERRQNIIDSGWDERDALASWIKLCGPVAMDKYIFNFIWNEMRLQDKGKINRYQNILSRLITFMLKHGMPMERVEPRPSFQEESRQARNSEEALLAAVNACARVTNTISEVEWSSATAFGDWISRLQGQRETDANVLSLECLSFLSLGQSNLYLRDLRGAKFQHADLEGANLIGANLEMANLIGANLAGADLEEAILRHANLEEANLERANLDRANLEKANLKGANLVEAHLTRSNLRDARLTDADLRDANLERAFIHATKIEGANLEHATWVNGKKCKEGSIGKCTHVI
jgi:uncharacterized protein YjbI with pentapeptide repeats